MAVTHREHPVEEFTITLKSDGSNTVGLTMEWENVAARVPIKVTP
jgi:hypothetical protein